MDEKQVIYAIYNYLYNSEANQKSAMVRKKAFLNDNLKNPHYIYAYWAALMRYENYKSFMLDILEILRYYEEGDKKIQ